MSQAVLLEAERNIQANLGLGALDRYHLLLTELRGKNHDFWLSIVFYVSLLGFVRALPRSALSAGIPTKYTARETAMAP